MSGPDLIDRLLGRRYRLPRRVIREPHLIRRKRDGCLFMTHHDGVAGLGALFGGPQFYFVALRTWRGRLVAALDLPAWRPRCHEFTILPERNAEIICIGRKVPLPIDAGGLGNIGRRL